MLNFMNLCSIYSYFLFIHKLCPIFNRLKFSYWYEQVQFHLGLLDFDLALQVEKPIDIIDISIAKEKSFHKALERSKRLNLIFM